ncbi:hypothetical protein Q1695_011229 [Nippostrongylus brasiliensis]|nr:hypothetical protein Q1695_011229 [Nippostrongylus brasiliensis]
MCDALAELGEEGNEDYMVFDFFAVFLTLLVYAVVRYFNLSHLNTTLPTTALVLFAVSFPTGVVGLLYERANLLAMYNARLWIIVIWSLCWMVYSMMSKAGILGIIVATVWFLGAISYFWGVYVTSKAMTYVTTHYRGYDDVDPDRAQYIEQMLRNLMDEIKQREYDIASGAIPDREGVSAGADKDCIQVECPVDRLNSVASHSPVTRYPQVETVCVSFLIVSVLGMAFLQQKPCYRFLITLSIQYLVCSSLSMESDIDNSLNAFDDSNDVVDTEQAKSATPPVKDSPPASWPAGDYCIMPGRSPTCPEGFVADYIALAVPVFFGPREVHSPPASWPAGDYCIMPGRSPTCPEGFVADYIALAVPVFFGPREKYAGDVGQTPYVRLGRVGGFNLDLREYDQAYTLRLTACCKQ